ncbi:aspartate aminotransferase family protein [Bifidobacterium psychraerophilum]|uniref:aminotransferase class III-fold pyridoxal phosphate-dependent enzyme n=1 Tax=Bifidobacterium psychraerophilum TaxID=218140 RepID=UPI0031163F58
MTASADELIARDTRDIAAAQKVRFFTQAMSGGRGSILFGPRGEEFIDLSATWTAAAIGYSDPRIQRAVHDCLGNCPGMGIGSIINEQTMLAAERLLELTDSVGYGTTNDDRRVYFGHSGSDANDIALRLCRRASEEHGGGRRVLAFEHSYHGGLGEALGLSGVQVEGGARPDSCVTFLPYPDAGHPHADLATPEEELAYCIESARQALGKGDVCCLIVEAILSDGGMIIPPLGFLSGLRELCDRFDVPMICDEVKVGLGRSGMLHAYQYEGIHPDIVTFGKALGGGLPISAIVGPAAILDCVPGSSLLTMGGNPVCSAAAVCLLDILTKEGLAEQALRKGEEARRYCGESIRNGDAAVKNHIVEVRGRGLSMAIELSDGTQQDSERFAEKVCFRAHQLGVVVYYVGGHVLEITPALNIDEQTLRLGLSRVLQAIGDVSAGMVGDDDIAGFGGW